MDVKYQVFISSTYEDLQEERKEVMQALLELDCIPSGMELFPAANEEQWELIKRVIDDCDYYLLIVGGRYGSINSKTGLSYTEMEYRYALEKGKPTISFLHQDSESLPVKKSEKKDDGKMKLEEFKKLVQNKLVKFWTTPQDLGSMISRSMINLIKTYPAIGWAKSDSIVDEKSMKEILDLQKENKELKEQLEISKTKPPIGTEDLSQGDEKVKIHFEFEATHTSHIDSIFNYCFNFSWNEIFSYIAPSFIDECREYNFKFLINQLIMNNSENLKKIKELKFYSKFRKFSVDNKDYELIKVQLKALGLITLSERKRTAREQGVYWTLTPYGDYHMTQLLAIRK